MTTPASDLMHLTSSPTGRTPPTADEIAVLGLAARGFYLFPIKKGGKSPLIAK